MHKRLLIATALFSLLIVAIIVGANANVLPYILGPLIFLPGVDKVGHFFLFGILSYLVNKSALVLFPKRNPARLVLIVSLILSILIGLEEWSQSLFPARTMSLVDLSASYVGLTMFAMLAYRARL